MVQHLDLDVAAQSEHFQAFSEVWGMVFGDVEYDTVIRAQCQIISDNLALRGEQGTVAGFAARPFRRSVGYKAFQERHRVGSL